MSVDHRRPRVKTPRAYDASRRRERAQRSRDALLDAARARFLEHGYVATTIDSIAADAGVSSATIYKTYGGKAGMVSALCERALEGAGPVPAEERSNALQASDRDARSLIEGWGRLVAEVAPRIAPLLLLLRDAAAQDEQAAALYAELDGARLARMAENARSLIRRRGLRDGAGFQDARDTLWLYSAPEFYDLLVRRRGWSVKRYSRFVADAMINALVDDDR